MKRKKFGETLIDAGLITQDQLDNALALQKGKNKKLGTILIELEYVNETQIAETLSKQLSLKLVSCLDYKPDMHLLKLITRETALHNLIMPLEKNGSNLFVAMANPLDYQTVENISFSTGVSLNIAVAPEDDILHAIEMFYGASHDTWGIIHELPDYDEAEFIQDDTADERQTISLQTLYKQSEAPPIVKLVTSIIADAVEAGASDIHIEPRENFVRVRYRIDGNLKYIHTFSKRIRDSVISRIKIISNLNITDRRHPQDGRSALKIKNKTIDLRVSTIPSIHGEKIVIRLLDPTSGLIPLRELGISNEILKPLIEIISQPQGMLLVTGPTGSGKTTTLYSILQQLENEIKNIITIEDPVEYKLKEITQIGINESIGFTFAGALRSVLRQDPDIIMVGEIRDYETAEIAARSALTGHFVLSTLHTNNAVSAITRLLDIGLESFLVNASVSCILAQRLVRKICPECKTKTDRPDIQGMSHLPELHTYYTGLGCSSCHHTGYRGRVGVYELLRIEADVRRIISGHFTEDDLIAGVNEVIPRTIIDDAWAKVDEGITTIEEVLSKVPYQSQRQGSAADAVKKVIDTRNKAVSGPDRIN